jgi:hypothetical protein
MQQFGYFFLQSALFCLKFLRCLNHQLLITLPMMIMMMMMMTDVSKTLHFDPAITWLTAQDYFSERL